MRVFGVWSGGGSYVTFGDIGSEGETWASLKDARESLRHRYVSGHSWRDRRGRVVDVDENEVARPGVVNDRLCPAVSRDCSIEVFESVRVGRGEWLVGEPCGRLVLGPRGGVRLERY